MTAKTTPSARSFTYDPQGNQITDTGKSLTYNYDNQLKTYQSGSLTTTYVYDATGNRTDKTQTGTGAVNYQYINAGNNQVLQAKNLTASTNQYYLYSLEQISQGDTANSSRQYPITDGVGAVRYLTNSSGTTVTNGTFSYNPFGKQTSGSATLSNYNFQSEQKDSESGMVYLRARYYDPTIGRFASQDPLSGALGDPAGQNGYNYAINNPVNLSDPTGQSAVGDYLYNATGLNDFRNTVASKCAGWSGIASAGAASAAKLAILYGSAAAAGYFGGAAIAGSGVGISIPAVYADGAAASVGEFTFTRTAAAHLTETILRGANAGRLVWPYMQSPLLIREIMTTGTGIADSSIPTALKYVVPGSLNGTKGTYELVVDPVSKVIYHFLFK